jgi:hypothetical protein
MSMKDERKKVIRANYAAFNNGDIDGALRNLHPEIELIGADEVGDFNEGEAWRGHDEARRFYEGIRRHMGMQWIEIEKLESQGEAIVATVWLHGSNEAERIEGAVPAVRRHIFDGLLIRRVETYRQGWRLPDFEYLDEDV